MHRNLTALAVAATVAAGGLTPAAASAKATTTGKHVVTVETYVYKEAGKVFDGTLFKKDTFTVKRLSKSGKWAYGFSKRINRHAWIKASALNKQK